MGVKGLSKSTLHLCTLFYRTYPQIVQTLSGQFETRNLLIGTSQNSNGKLFIDAEILVNHLSFSHFVELMKCDSDFKKYFYETETIKNNWSVRELQRAMNSLLFERIGLSQKKMEMLDKFNLEKSTPPETIIKEPYILEFLGFEEKSEYSENDLETAIINHLQKFLIELGRGFCFETRQKRITFDNTHYKIDLVFYHRILKCHVLIDLKIGEFSHADAGQMNLYLNYYKDQEISEGDNEPIGIILCAGKNDSLVKYATGGLSQKVFVSKYLINLPKEEELKEVLKFEQSKLK